MLFSALSSAFASSAINKMTGGTKKASDRTASAIMYQGAADRATRLAEEAKTQANVGIKRFAGRAKDNSFERIVDEIYVPAINSVGPDQILRALRSQAIAEGKSKITLKSISDTFSSKTEGLRLTGTKKLEV